MEEAKRIKLNNEMVLDKIYLIRNQKVMLDRDLAQLYGVETKQLKRQVNRNIERFPIELCSNSMQKNMDF